MRSFTLLEVILAITVLTLAVGGSFVLISQTIASISMVQSKLVASYLSQEGIEIVKNIRDTNWLKENNWDEGLGAGDYRDYEADYDDLSLTECPSPCDYDHDYSLHFLKIPDQGFYNYDLGDPTIFKRKITISDKVDLDGDEEADRLKVSVEVLWKEKGKFHLIIAQEYLYNWYSMIGGLVSATETLRPNAAGSETAWSYVSGAPTHWEAVKDVVANEGATYLRTWLPPQRDLFDIPAHSVGSGTINKVTVFFRSSSNYATGNYDKASIKTHGIVYDGDAKLLDTSWQTFSQEWAKNSFTSAAWTWDEIDALEIGVQAASGGNWHYCTQVYVEVYYQYYQ